MYSCNAPRVLVTELCRSPRLERSNILASRKRKNEDENENEEKGKETRKTGKKRKGNMLGLENGVDTN